MKAIVNLLRGLPPLAIILLGAIVSWCLIFGGSILALALLSKNAAAQGWGMEVHGASFHRDAGTWCESNPGVGASHAVANGANVLHAGVYRNSYCRTSFYLAAEWLPIEIASARLGGGGGCATGYPYLPIECAPYLKAQIPVPFTPRTHFSIRGIPSIPDKTKGLLTISIGHTF